MNFYSLTIDINDRREHQLELFNQQSEHRLRKSKRFVIDVPNFNSFKVLSIANAQYIKSFVMGTYDIDISKCTSQISANGQVVTLKMKYDKPLALHPEPKPIIENPEMKSDISFEDIEEHIEYNAPKPAAPVKETTPSIIESSRDSLGELNEYLSLSYEQNHYGIKLEAHLTQSLTEMLYDRDTIEVVVQLEVDGALYENSVLITLSHPAAFLGLALDFGSESSQMAVKRYEAVEPFYAHSPDNENLFRNIVAFHKNKGWIPKDSTYDFYQEEPGTNFYKSLFFLREQLSGDYQNVDQEPSIKHPQDNLKMLVNKADGYSMLMENKYYQLPNLKILHKHERVLEDYNFEIEKDGYPINLKLRELKQKVYNTILENMIESFLKKEFIRYDGAERNIRMMLLIPNNYDSKDINKTQYHLNNIFESLSKRAEYQGKIKSWEILTISESDASFIGYINKNNVNVYNNRDYVIIDSGKGTTDFSIIRTGAKNLYNLNPIYRNGFTGAGNMLTYAVFETVLHFLREQSPAYGEDVVFIKNRILDILKGNNLESRNLFYNQLERLKFNYRNTDQLASIKRTWKEAADGQTTMSNIIESGTGIDALTNILSRINSLTDFYGYIQDACQFIVNNVVSYLKIVKENKTDIHFGGVILTGRAFKFQLLADLLKAKIHQELHIPLDDIHLLEGNELKDICIKGVFNNAIKLNAELTGYPIQLVYKSVNDVPVSEIVNAKPKKPLGKRIFNFFINDLADMQQVEEIVSVEDQVDFNVLQRSQFLIGCKRYSIRNEEFFITQPGLPYTASVDFTQRGFVMRRKIGDKIDLISALEEIDEGGSGDKALIVPSLFPNYIDEAYIESINTESIEKDTSNTYTGQFDFYTPPNYGYNPSPKQDPPKNNDNNNSNLFF